MRPCISLTAAARGFFIGVPAGVKSIIPSFSRISSSSFTRAIVLASIAAISSSWAVHSTFAFSLMTLIQNGMSRSLSSMCSGGNSSMDAACIAATMLSDAVAFFRRLLVMQNTPECA